MLVLERDLSQPDRIVGELLQPGGYLMLKKMGLEKAVEEIDSTKVSHFWVLRSGHSDDVNAQVGMFRSTLFHASSMFTLLQHGHLCTPMNNYRANLVKTCIRQSWQTSEEQDWFLVRSPVRPHGHGNQSEAVQADAAVMF